MGIQFLPELVQTVLLVIGVAVFVMVKLAPRYPRVAWLQAFRHVDRRTEEQKRRDHRRASIMGGLQFIGFGIAIPPAYLILEMMFWSTTSRGEIVIVSAVAMACISIGIVAILRTKSV